MDQRECRGGCARTLPATAEHFSLAKANRLGLSYSCRACVAARSKARYDADPETARRKSRESQRRRDPVKMLATARAYRDRPGVREERNRRSKELDYPAKGRARVLLAKYGITPADFDRMNAAQGGRCATCRALPCRGRLHVDHDHETGIVRGLLCFRCNSALGLIEEDPTRLAALARYLERGCVRMVRREA